MAIFKTIDDYIFPISCTGTWTPDLARRPSNRRPSTTVTTIWPTSITTITTITRITTRRWWPITITAPRPIETNPPLRITTPSRPNGGSTTPTPEIITRWHRGRHWMTSVCVSGISRLDGAPRPCNGRKTIFRVSRLFSRHTRRTRLQHVVVASSSRLHCKTTSVRPKFTHTDVVVFYVLMKSFFFFFLYMYLALFFYCDLWSGGHLWF